MISQQPTRVAIAEAKDGTPVYITRAWQVFVDTLTREGGTTLIDLTALTTQVAAIEAVQQVEIASYRPPNYADLVRRIERLELKLLER